MRVDVQDLKTSLHFGLSKVRSTFEAFIGVLVVDRAMMFACLFATFNHKKNETKKLRVSVIRVVDVCNGLNNISLYSLN